MCSVSIALFYFEVSLLLSKKLETNWRSFMQTIGDHSDLLLAKGSKRLQIG